MRRSPRLFAAFAVSIGCYSVPPEIDYETDPVSGSGSTQGGDTTATGPSTGAATDTPTTSTNPTSGPGTGANPTETDPTDDTGTTEPQPCSGSDECGDNVCAGGECVPCGDADDPDAACADANPDTPICSEDGSLCVACTPTSCGGSSPACDPDVGCVACTEHSECPESACHLGGTDQGSCFDVADVVEVSDTTELGAALEGAGSGGQLVVHLLPGTLDYTGYAAFYYQEGVHPQEIALIGNNTTITGGATTLIFAPPLLYVSDVEFSSGPGRAISCASEGEVWADDSRFEGYGTAILGCATRLRRSQVRGDPKGADFGGTLAVPSLTATNSDLGPGGDPMLSVSEDMDLRYVTLVGNVRGLACETGASGSVRNSILVNPGTSVEGCSSVGFTNNAHDQPGQGLGGTVVADYDPTWFVISDGSRFFLSESGQEVFAGIADWDEGDPLFDIEGDPRPQEAPGYPGVDEP